MKVVIDLQGVQCQSMAAERREAILALAKDLAITRNEEDELLIVLNGGLDPIATPVGYQFESIIAEQGRAVWFPQLRQEGDGGVDSMRVPLTERLYEGFLASLKPDLVIIPELWFGLQAETLASPSGPNRTYGVMVVLPDKRQIQEILAVRNGVGSSRVVERFFFQLSRVDRYLQFPGAAGDVASTLHVPPHLILDLPRAGSGVSLWETCRALCRRIRDSFERPIRRRRLAFVSPLPPAKTGIAYYSANLLRELVRYYDIDVVSVGPAVENAWIQANFLIRDSNWLVRNDSKVDYVLYHFGNSFFHAEMWELLRRVPGVVVLHDLFVGGALEYLQQNDIEHDALFRRLRESHGYPGLIEYSRTGDVSTTIDKFPCSFDIFRDSRGVIVHSEHAADLARSWYGEAWTTQMTVVPHLRFAALAHDRAGARGRLGIPDDQFLVCSFGAIEATKLSHRIFEAWRMSALYAAGNASLVFVGESESKYAKGLVRRIHDESESMRIRVTGWASDRDFEDYMAAADLSVQLRCGSRGESSGTILDCMALGLPVICNAHGSLRELPGDAVWALPEYFQDAELGEALQVLWKDPARRMALANRAQREVEIKHGPWNCALGYRQAIDAAYSVPIVATERIAVALIAAEIGGEFRDAPSVAAAIGATLPERWPVKQILVDVSVLAVLDHRTGVQRVVRGLLRALMERPPAGYRIEPVYNAPGTRGYFYATRFTQRFMSGTHVVLSDEPVDMGFGDVFLGLDLHTDGIVRQEGWLKTAQYRGTRVMFILHDLLPVTHPHWFPSGESTTFEKWLRVIVQFDGIVCVSRSTADGLVRWLQAQQVRRSQRLMIHVSYNGSDVQSSVPSTGMAEDAQDVLRNVTDRPTILMVGTVEPRKGYQQALEALERLWQGGRDLNLVIVGKQGWLIDDLAMRLESHPELHHRLFWLKGISDEFLEALYSKATCLLAASEGEGFGLPIVEGARHGLPIIARDIPVFREIGGQSVYYFSARDGVELAGALVSWLEAFATNRHPSPDGIHQTTWAESAENMLACIFCSKPYAFVGS